MTHSHPMHGPDPAYYDDMERDLNALLRSEKYDDPHRGLQQDREDREGPARSAARPTDDERAERAQAFLDWFERTATPAQKRAAGLDPTATVTPLPARPAPSQRRAA
jgi:hypothetical protein